MHTPEAIKHEVGIGMETSQLLPMWTGMETSQLHPRLVNKKWFMSHHAMWECHIIQY